MKASGTHRDDSLDESMEASWASSRMVRDQDDARRHESKRAPVLSTCSASRGRDAASLPGITLFVTTAAPRESESAFESLDAIGILFHVCADNDAKAPFAIWEGTTYRGLGGVTALASALSAFRDELIARVRERRPRLSTGISNEAAMMATREREEQRSSAHADLEAILDGRR